MNELMPAVFLIKGCSLSWGPSFPTKGLLILSLWNGRIPLRKYHILLFTLFPFYRAFLEIAGQSGRLPGGLRECLPGAGVASSSGGCCRPSL